MTDAGVMSARLAALLPREDAAGAALRLVTVVVTAALPGSIGAGVTLGTEGTGSTAAASCPVVERADELQYGLDEGPCLTAWQRQVVVRIDEIRTEPRWPRWARAVEPLGIRSSLAAPLTTAGDRIGVIQVYSPDSAAYGGREERLLTLLARQTTMLLITLRTAESTRRLAEELVEALRAENVVGRAEGLLMMRDGVDGGTASATLRRAAEESGQEVREVARRLVETGALPHRPPVPYR